MMERLLPEMKAELRINQTREDASLKESKEEMMASREEMKANKEEMKAKLDSSQEEIETRLDARLEKT
jgi:uncharacterized protein YqfA (UPF0365 family)